MVEQKYVFLVSGWGLGHATRSWAIIEQILNLDSSSKIIVFTWGSGISFFKSKLPHFEFELHLLSSYFEIDGLETGRAARINLAHKLWAVAVWIKNSVYIHQHLKNQSNLVCIVDSDYHFLSYFFKASLLASISQTPFIIHHWRQNFSKFSLLMNIRFVFFEWFDYFLQKLFCDIVFSPSFYQLAEYNKKIKFIPPIVRSEFLISRQGSAVHEVGVIGSGSTYSEEIKQKTRKLKYVYEEKNEFGLDANGLPLIDKFSRLITQCGFSSLSECFARSKPMVLDPIANHPEQVINACVLVAMNKASFFAKPIISMQMFRQPMKAKNWVQCNGAEVLARSLKTL